MKKNIVAGISFFILIIISLLLITIFRQDQIENDSEKIQIIATLFPQYDFAKQIIGDKGDVKLLLNSGVETHNYEPTPKDMITINNSDVFLYTGNDLEPWAESIVDSIENTCQIVDVSKEIDLIKIEDFEERHINKLFEYEYQENEQEEQKNGYEEEQEQEELEDQEEQWYQEHQEQEERKEQAYQEQQEQEEKEELRNQEEAEPEEEQQGDEEEQYREEKERQVSQEDTHEGHMHKHEEIYDGHIWLNPQNAIKMIDNILQIICEIDNENKDYYTKNAEEYKREIIQLDKELENVVNNAQSKEIAVGGEFAYAYLVERYDIDFVSVYNNCGDGEDPSISKVKSVIDYMNKNKLNVVFYEELTEGTVAKMIAEETGAESLVLYSIHNADISKDSYVSLFRKNIENLRKALN